MERIRRLSLHVGKEVSKVTQRPWFLSIFWTTFYVGTWNWLKRRMVRRPSNQRGKSSKWLLSKMSSLSLRHFSGRLADPVERWVQSANSRDVNRPLEENLAIDITFKDARVTSVTDKDGTIAIFVVALVISQETVSTVQTLAKQAGSKIKGNQEHPRCLQFLLCLLRTQLVNGSSWKEQSSMHLCKSYSLVCGRHSYWFWSIVHATLYPALGLINISGATLNTKHLNYCHIWNKVWKAVFCVTHCQTLSESPEMPQEEYSPCHVFWVTHTQPQSFLLSSHSLISTWFSK